MQHITFLFIAAMSFALDGCGGGGGSGTTSGNGGGSGQPAPTGIGESLGAPVSKVIGVDGGSLSSADGRLSVSVPAGALAANTTIAIEPITDMTREGQGTAYRLTPHGEIFAQPVTLSFNYGDDEIAGSAPENLKLAFQREDGYWQLVPDPVLDSASKRISVETTHFSDWVHVPEYLLIPVRDTVKVGESLQLHVLDCVEPLPDDQSVEAVIPGCYATSVEDYLLSGGDGWYVNGVMWGNGTVGSVEIGDDPANPIYTAPATKPEPNQVAVSVTFTRPLVSSQTQLVSQVTILGDNNTYSGAIHYTRGDLDATATVTWTKFEEGGDYSDYLGSGTISGTVACGAPFSVALAPGTASEPLSQMSVFNDIAAQPFTNSHQFVLQPNPETTITVKCDGQTITLPAGVVGVIVGQACAAPADSIVHHADIEHLTGTWDCAVNGVQADWDLVLGQ
jgi:hypothetical protein